MLKELQGKVVLIDFWTYSCINCVRTFPGLKRLWEQYGGSGIPFVIVGVHTPEFVFEKSEKNVADAIRRHGLGWPIAQDNDYATWEVFSNHYWPAKYLIDAEGYIRYTHFGEGGYGETEEAIRSLLEEAGVDTTHVTPSRVEERTRSYQGERVSFDSAQDDTFGRRELTPETYLGARSWPAFAKATAGKPAAPDDAIHQYVPPSILPLHAYTLSGDWQLVDGERQVLRSPEGEIRMTFLGGEINLVLGLEKDTSPVEAEVWVDGRKTQSFTVDHDDLYALWKGEYGGHEVMLKLRGRGISGYAFTFGS